jgi:hypothetical protein
MLFMVMLQLPSFVAKTINQTLLFTMLSPHVNAGSVPDAVAPVVDLVNELPAHKVTAEAQLSWALVTDTVNKNNMTKNKYRLNTVFFQASKITFHSCIFFKCTMNY